MAPRARRQEPSSRGFGGSAILVPRLRRGARFLLGWLFIIAGGLGAFYVPVSAWRTTEFVHHAVHAQAPIVAFQSYPPGRHETHDTYRAIIEIVGGNGGPVRDPVGTAAYPNPHRLGKRVAVLYARENPAKAVRDTPADVWGGTLMLAVVAPFMLIMGVGIVFWMRYFVHHAPERLVWIDRWFAPLKLLAVTSRPTRGRRSKSWA